MQPGYRASSIVVRMLIIMQRDENDRVHIKRKRAICAFNRTTVCNNYGIAQMEKQ